ncbi:VOC family protein [Geodermatophilus marinus]|uniref:hypothetical protein n=1 Tax=Geodermatophilus sp. LHW52908 TaxID=2303986 RepID=UPI0018F4410D|nr:hypothetical protein [Geodermatophilus sp. LHW52908]
MPPLHEIAHLGHVELRTPVLEQGVEFCTRYLGPTCTGEAGDSVFLRAWDDHETTTLTLTAHATSGVGRTHLRAAGPEALARRVAAIEAAGRGVGWRPVDWTEAERAEGQAWGLETIETFHTHGTPPVQP